MHIWPNVCSIPSVGSEFEVKFMDNEKFYLIGPFSVSVESQGVIHASYTVLNKLHMSNAILLKYK